MTSGMSDGGEVVVWGLGPTWGAPSPSPFAIKLATWLRMAKVPHRMSVLKSPPRSSTGKVPYVELPDGRRLADSQLIIETLAQERGIDLDAHLDAAARARGHLVRRTLEESLYFGSVWERFMTDEGFACVKRDYFRGAPWPVRAIAPSIVHRNIRKILHGQGTGRLPPPVIAARVQEDLDAIAAVFGEGPFLLGGQPSSFDAALFGFAWALQVTPYPSVAHDALLRHPSLVAYVERMKARYWSDWTAPAASSAP